MSGPPTRERHPGANRVAITKNTGGRSEASLEQAAVAGELTAALDGVLVVIVATGPGHYRRRVFLTLSAAQRAAHRAREAGYPAALVLAELRPVGRLAGGGQ